MVIGAFPVAKLGALLLKQISKPIANYLKHQAKSSLFFRTYICMPPAQFYNWCEVKTKMWILNLGKPVNIPVLNEAMAIELGANLLGEAIIFGIAAAMLVSEYNRSSRKEAAKEAEKEDMIRSLNTEMQELFFRVEEQRAQMNELLRVINDLDSRMIKKPGWTSKRSSEPDEPPKEPPPSAPTIGLPSVLGQETNFVNTDRGKTNPTVKSTSNSVVAKALEIVDSDILNNSNAQRESGILTLALNHFYGDVYRISLNMY